MECTPNAVVSTTSLWRCSADEVNNVCRAVGDVVDDFSVIDSFNKVLGWIRVSVVRPDKVNYTWKTLSNTGNHYAILKEFDDHCILYQACVNVIGNNDYIHNINTVSLDWLDELVSHLFNIAVQQQIEEDNYGFDEKD